MCGRIAQERLREGTGSRETGVTARSNESEKGTVREWMGGEEWECPGRAATLESKIHSYGNKEESSAYSRLRGTVGLDSSCFVNTRLGGLLSEVETGREGGLMGGECGEAHLHRTVPH